jgi:predicted nucleotidyltransferase
MTTSRSGTSARLYGRAVTDRQRRLVEATTRWAEAEPRVRALVLKGSLAQDKGDELSDIDLIAVTEPGEREELWAEREAIVGRFGKPLGVFREAEWATPYMVIALYAGPLTLDLAFEEERLAPDPWLRDGYEVLAGSVEAPELAEPSQFGEAADLRELDAHAWDYARWLHVTLERGERWVAYLELGGFLHDIVLLALNATHGEGWSAGRGVDERLEPEVLAELETALPHSAEPDEIRRALLAAAELYAKAREELKAHHDPELPDELMRQVLARLRGAPAKRD